MHYLDSNLIYFRNDIKEKKTISSFGNMRERRAFTWRRLVVFWWGFHSGVKRLSNFYRLKLRFLFCVHNWRRSFFWKIYIELKKGIKWWLLELINFSLGLLIEGPFSTFGSSFLPDLEALYWLSSWRKFCRFDFILIHSNLYVKS